MADDQGPSSPFDLQAWLRGLNVPGLDIDTALQSVRKDVEALQQANQVAFEGWQKLAERQAELLQGAAQRWQESLTDSAGTTPAENMDRIREGFEQALSNMRELAEIASQSQQDAFEIMRKRFEENLKTLSGPAKTDEGSG